MQRGRRNRRDAAGQARIRKRQEKEVEASKWTGYSLPLFPLPHLLRDSGRAKHYNLARVPLSFTLHSLSFPPSLPSPTLPLPLFFLSLSFFSSSPRPLLPPARTSFPPRCSITTRCRDTRPRFSRVKPSLIPGPRSIRYERGTERLLYSSTLSLVQHVVTTDVTRHTVRPRASSRREA